MPKISGEVVGGIGGAPAFGSFPPARWSDGEKAALYCGDVREVLRRLPSNSVHCCVTSPPYWGLRDYGTAKWEGGSADCDHATRDATSTLNGPSNKEGFALNTYRYTCGKCGAKRVDDQIGMEEVHDCLGWATGLPCGECFVCHMVEVFREVRRVLRRDGTLWLNLGDTFDNGSQKMVPVRTAMALEADGWKLVQDIIWAKPGPMPESVTNRCSKSHEHIFLLAKSEDYYFDHEVIKESAKSIRPNKASKKYATEGLSPQYNGTVNQGQHKEIGGSIKANKRDVWTVQGASFAGAHFATFSPALITPCILAGTSEYGCCGKCGAPYERVVYRYGAVVGGRNDRDRSLPSNHNADPNTGSTLDGVPSNSNTLGWSQTCGCEGLVLPCVVLDPFSGSGTTVATSVKLGRAGVGIDLNQKYTDEFAISRVKDALVNYVPAQRGSVLAASMMDLSQPDDAGAV